jgi:hypothetical protein
LTSTRRLAAAVLLVLATRAGAHPAPFSYLDLAFNATASSGTLVIHDFDVAHELGVPAIEGSEAASRHRGALFDLMSRRLAIEIDGELAELRWLGLVPLTERQSLRLTFEIPKALRARARVRARLFPYDPAHQTFLNVSENGELRQQSILSATDSSVSFFAGGAQGLLALLRIFIGSGIHHILIGPDHVLFLVGLLLLGGSWIRTVAIVTAFTIGHSVTLGLAVLEILRPPGRVVEPLIALTVIVVGVDAVLVLRDRSRGGETGRDVRAPLALVFGLIHGFGFALVLREFGLPTFARGFSLFAFNLGVEIGQIVIVAVALGFGLLLRRALSRVSNSPGGEAIPRLEAAALRAGAIGVILAGTYWFFERTLL